jgi:hypothetical protein
MDKQSSNRLNMGRTVKGQLDANATIVAGIPALGTLSTALNTTIVLIDNLNVIASGTTKGVTLDTRELRQSMEDKALQVAAATLAYANVMNNNALAEKVKVSATDFRKLKKEVVDDVCERVMNAANEFIANLGDYGIVASDISTLGSLIDVYRIQSQNPRNKKISISQAKRRIKEEVKGMMDNLFRAKLDQLMLSLKGSHPDFYNSYRQAREIIDLGRTSAKLRGTVKNEGGQLLKNVKVSLLEKGSMNVVKFAMSDSKGKFSITEIPAGEYDGMWYLAGYLPFKTEDLKFTAGKEIMQHVVLIQEQ